MKAFIGVALLAIAAATKADNICPSEQAADWSIELLFSHKNCEKFYKCTFGHPVEQDCPSGLYFNDKTWQCDWANLVDCGDRIDPAQVPDSEAGSDGSSDTDGDSGNNGDNGTDGDSGNTETDGDNGTDGENGTDGDSGNTETDGDNGTDGDNDADGDSGNTVTDGVNETDGGDGDGNDSLSNGCPVNPHVHTLLPHENNCNEFYYCVWGEKVLRECPASLHFNPVLQVCDWPTAAGCATSFSKHADQRRLMSRI